MEAMHPHPGHRVQRLLWAVGEAHRHRGGGQVLGRRRRDAAMAPASAPMGPGTTTAGAGRPGLELHLVVHGGHAYLSLRGELDGATAGEFLDRVHALVEQGARSIVVDLGGAEVIGGGALAALASAATLVDELRGEMILRSPRSATLRLLDTAGLGGRFVIC